MKDMKNVVKGNGTHSAVCLMTTRPTINVHVSYTMKSCTSVSMLGWRRASKPRMTVSNRAAIVTYSGLKGRDGFRRA